MLMPTQKRTVKHHAALPYVDLPAFIARLRDRPGFTARALELLILTAARTSEITGARWQEIDLEHKVWTIPTDRMKAGRPHRVPLSNRAVSLLKTMPRDQEGDFVFPGARKGKPLSPMAMDMMLQRMGHKGAATVHGFRSAFRDWAADNHYRDDIAELALAHSKGTQTEKAYLRSDLLERRVPLMADWAAYCSGTPVKKSANVTPLRARA